LKTASSTQDSLKQEMIKLNHIIQDMEKDFNRDLEEKCLQIVDLEDQLTALSKEKNNQLEEL